MARGHATDGPPKDQIARLTALFGHGRFQDALTQTTALIERFPRAAVLHNIQGAAFASLGCGDDAVASYRTALRLKGDYVEVMNNLATLFNGLERYNEAAEISRTALGLRPQYAEAHNALGNALCGLGQLDDAIANFSNALRYKPEYAEAYYNLGVVLAQAGRHGEAIVSYRQALSLRPNHAEAYNNIGNAYAAIEEADEAIANYTKALEIRPGYAEAHNNLGNILNDLGRHDEAVASYRRALQGPQSPSTPRYYFNLGLALKARGDFADALAAYDNAYALDPDLPDLVYNRAIAAMTLGRFAEGLAGYETRWTIAEPSTELRTFAVPRWSGAPMDGGKSVLVWAEQGVGDHILYSSLLEDTVRRAGQVVFECDPRLAGLVSRAFPGVAVRAAGEGSGRDVGAEIPMGSLMRVLAPWPEGFVPPSRFLEPDPARTAACQAALADTGSGPRIGIAWRSARRKTGPKKSIPLDQWAPILANRDARFVNLQYGETDAEIAEAKAAFGCTIFTDPTIDRFDDLEGLAAMIDALDLVVCTSNVTAHLAGALGKPCLLMVQRAPIWYWGAEGQGTRFYPSVQIFRQTVPPVWDDVVAAVATAIDQKFG